MVEARFYELFTEGEGTIAAMVEPAKAFEKHLKSQKTNQQKLVETKRELDFLESAYSDKAKTKTQDHFSLREVSST